MAVKFSPSVDIVSVSEQIVCILHDSKLLPKKYTNGASIFKKAGCILKIQEKSDTTIKEWMEYSHSKKFL